MIRIFNTLSGTKQTLRTKRAKQLKLFVCGPTVYDFSHIGHARTYIAFDVIAKYLRHMGFDVFYLQNITDVDDKIIQRARDTKQDPKTLAQRFEKDYLQDMKALGINAVTKYARATSHIKEIISQVKRLLQKGYAYEIPRDGIYCDISKFEDYGKLSHRTTQQAEDAISRIDESIQKRNKGDFALWKFSKPNEPHWKSSWGLGRPGWHIEDTAITEKYFGPQYNIHGGARDLIFPHHEAEITQMEAISGKKPLVRYWMHTGFLTVKGEKMSKSLGNFVTIRDFLAKHPARLLRFFVAKTHYRSSIDYSEELLDQARSELKRIDEFIDKLTLQLTTYNLRQKTYGKRLTPRKNSKSLAVSRKSLERAMEDDFNTPVAIASLFRFVTEGNSLFDKNAISKADAKKILGFLKEIDMFFGFIFWGKEKKEKIPQEILEIVRQREEYRKRANWQKADEMRKEINKRGWSVEDTPTGPRLTLSSGGGLE